MITATRCQCGAISVEDTESGVTNHMKRATFRQLYPGMRTVRGKEWRSCDHCANHWGIDICGCGSGRSRGKCDGGFPECRRNQPYEVMGRRNKGAIESMVERGGFA